MIKNIVFDFGDVFLNLDKPATKQALSKYGIEDYDKNMVEHNRAYERGELDSNTFISFYCRQHEKLSREQFIDSWNAVLIDFPHHRLNFLKSLKNQDKYRLFLLSNTNELHIDWVKKNIRVYEDFKAQFDGFYLSYEIKARKPEARIFEYVLNRHQLDPSQTLFIDDTPECTDAARKLGLQTWNLDPQHEDVSMLFSKKSRLF